MIIKTYCTIVNVLTYCAKLNEFSAQILVEENIQKS